MRIKRGKKGIIGMSFGMMFSIFLIIAIIAIAFYTINYFLDLQRCTEVSLFYQDFQDKVDTAWSSEITKREFTGSLPGGIKSVCFGNLNQSGAGEEYEELRKYRVFEANMFLYPIRKTCDLAYINIQHIDLTELQGWHCFPVEGGKVETQLEKGSFDALVKIKEVE